VITLRPASKKDLGKVRELLTAARLPLDGVSDCIDKFIVAESDGSMVGSIGLERYGDYALLRSAAVAESYRGKGVGHKLVDALLARAASDGVKTMYLLTTTADAWFPEFGFATIDRSWVPDAVMASREFMGACPSSATVMRKNLAAQ
jgi:amino-acid N-acetyltransferase